MRNPSITGAEIVTPTRTLTFDATLRENIQRNWQVTEHETEDGSPIVDHVRERPLEFTIEVIATTTPVGNPAAVPNAERDRKFRDQIAAIADARELCTVTCETGVFENCVIKTIAEQHSQSSGEAFVASITFRQIRVAERQTTTLPPLPPIQREVATEQDRGAQTGQDPAPDAAEEAVDGSLLYGLGGNNDDAVRANLNNLNGFLGTFAGGG